MSEYDVLTQSLIETFVRDRFYAHSFLFGEHRTHPSPLFHKEILESWHDPGIARLLIMAFRGAAKSTLAEEAACLMALLGERMNTVILGESEDRAVERLRAVAHEIEHNEAVEAVFGDQVGPQWGATRIVLKNGACLQARGRGQSLRGVKHLTRRPDLVILDDVEDEASVASKEGRAETLRWMVGTVVPALAPGGLLRMMATPLCDGPTPEDKALPVRLRDSGAWRTIIAPIKYKDAVTGADTPSWPSRYPLSVVEAMRSDMESMGAASEFDREYMCDAATDATRDFSSWCIPRPSPSRPRSLLQQAYMTVDPARTSGARSDLTGVVVYSWVEDKLIVWESAGLRAAPDIMLKTVAAMARAHDVTAVGVEKDGLDDFVTTPLRRALLGPGSSIPVVALKAPRGKRDFIRTLQPWLAAGSVELVGPSHDRLRQELAAFPNGGDDVVNALAYALRMRPVSRYALGPRNISDERIEYGRHWLAMAVGRGVLVAALVVLRHPRVAVLAGWTREGPLHESVAEIVADAASLIDGSELLLTASPRHHAALDDTGLRAAVAKAPATLRRSGDPTKGGVVLDAALRSFVEPPRFIVSPSATDVVKALSSRLPDDSLVEMDLMCEALESLLAATIVSESEASSPPRWVVAPDGRRYMTAAPGRSMESVRDKRGWGVSRDG